MTDDLKLPYPFTPAPERWYSMSTAKLTRLGLQRVHYMPEQLEPGILYVSDEFDVAIHLCACGCGNKVVTPLGPTGWTFTDAPRGPSLSPSIGNYQIPCRTHYWINDGDVEWLA